MRDYNAVVYEDLSQEEARGLAKAVVEQLDPSTIKNDSMTIDYRMLKLKMDERPETDFHPYELEKLVPLYKHLLRQVAKN